MSAQMLSVQVVEEKSFCWGRDQTLIFQTGKKKNKVSQVYN